MGRRGRLIVHVCLCHRCELGGLTMRGWLDRARPPTPAAAPPPAARGRAWPLSSRDAAARSMAAATRERHTVCRKRKAQQAAAEAAGAKSVSRKEHS
jgi:hypothetical protein